MNKKIFRGVLILAVAVITASGCSEIANNPASGSIPTKEPVVATSTPIPTNTPAPTNTPVPTSTPTPTVHIHNLVVTAETLPTCSNPQGTREMTCECGEKQTEEFTEVIEHTFGDYSVVTESTVQAVGEKLAVCTVCGAEKREEIPMLTPTPTPTNRPTPTPMATLSPDATRREIILYNLNKGAYNSYSSKRESFWYKVSVNHKQTASTTNFNMADYNMFFRSTFVNDDSEDKVVYLTMDCGYASPNCNANLDVFKKYNVPVTFFVTSWFINDSHDVLLRMREEGHNIGSHTMKHPEMSGVDNERLVSEICDLEVLLYEKTGLTMDPLFRFPYGVYSLKSLKVISDLGYSSFMWSIAMNDYDQNNQPSVEAVVNNVTSHLHNGAIILMHMDSSANRKAMEQVITSVLEMGYRFGNLYELREGQE